MNATHVRDLALKLLGIYYIDQLFSALYVIGYMLIPAAAYPELTSMRVLGALTALLQLALTFGVTYLLLFKTRRVMTWLWPASTDESADPPPVTPYATGIGLFGIWFLVHAVFSLVNQLWWHTFRYRAETSAPRLDTVLPCVQIVIAILCIRYSRRLAQFIIRRNA